MIRCRGRFIAAILTASLVMSQAPVYGLAAESGSTAMTGAEAGGAAAEQEADEGHTSEEDLAEEGDAAATGGVSDDAEADDTGADADAADAGDASDNADTGAGTEDAETGAEEGAGSAEDASDDTLTDTEDAEADDASDETLTNEEDEETDTVAADTDGASDDTEESTGSANDASGDALTEEDAADTADASDEVWTEAEDTEAGTDAANAGGTSDASAAEAADPVADAESTVSISGENGSESDLSFGDSDELFQDYFDDLFYGEGSGDVNNRRKSSAENLTGNNRIIYWKIRNAAAAIASGKRASTIITIPFKDLGVDVSKRYTAGELGVSAIRSGNSITQDAKDKMVEKVDFSLSTVQWALQIDCPSEFYWCDSIAVLDQVGLRADDDQIWYTTDSVEIGLKVNNYYASSTYKANTARTGAAQKAVSNANAIVQYAKSMGDRAKLLYYKNKLLALSDYNHTAAANKTYSINSNPWEMIYAFDGDPSTKVLCSGYAMAFKYLCDKTSFNNNTISAIYASGQLGLSSADQIGHAWNIVHMDDGRNYLVDVTNSARDTIGADGSLFLKGPVSGSIRGGYGMRVSSGKVYYYVYDSNTLNVYNSAELALSPVNYGVPAAHKHTYGAWILTRAATERVLGIRVKQCSICGDTVLQDVYPLTAANTKVTGLKSMTYTGKAIKQKITVTRNGRTLMPGTDYTVSYKNNKNVGKATITIKGIGAYGFSFSKTFKINPRASKLIKLTAGSKRLKAKWSKRKAQSSGYQIQCALNKKFTSGKKSFFIRNTGQVTKVIKGLKNNKKYYVRVRTFKRVGSKRFYSRWSKVKSIKTK